MRDEADYDIYFEDTMRAGHYENRRGIRGYHDPLFPADYFRNLIGYAVWIYAKGRGGCSNLPGRGAHSRPADFVSAKTMTGKEITRELCWQGLWRASRCYNSGPALHDDGSDRQKTVAAAVCWPLGWIRARERMRESPGRVHGSCLRRDLGGLLQPFHQLSAIMTGDALRILRKTRSPSGTSGLCADSSYDAVFGETGAPVSDFGIRTGGG